MLLSTKKSGDLQICTDPRPLKLVLKREHHKLSVMEDFFFSGISGATLFSVCDLEAGYHHCELDIESSPLTTFATPFGRYRQLRLPFGRQASSEIFQKRLHQALEGLDGVRCVADDVLMFGDENTHDERMRKFYKDVRKLGLSLTRIKVSFVFQKLSSWVI